MTTAFILIGILIALDAIIIGGCIRLEKDDATRALEDEEQLKYIREYNEKRRKKHDNHNM